MSQTVTKDVKAQGKVVGQVEIEVFDNLDEASDALGDEKCTALINKSHAIAEMDAVRREATGSTSTGIRALMAALKEDPDAMQALKEKYGVGA